MPAIQMQQLLSNSSLQTHHDTRISAAIGTCGIKAASNEVIGTDIPLLQHLQYGIRAYCSCAGGHLRHVNEAILACKDISIIRCSCYN